MTNPQGTSTFCMLLRMYATSHAFCTVGLANGMKMWFLMPKHILFGRSSQLIAVITV